VIQNSDLVTQSYAVDDLPGIAHVLYNLEGVPLANGFTRLGVSTIHILPRLPHPQGTLNLWTYSPFIRLCSPRVSLRQTEPSGRFSHAGGWQVQFCEADLKTPLLRTFTFADPEKIRELARRGEAWGDSESRQMPEAETALSPMPDEWAFPFW
jgi:hypothetical protein